MWDIRKKLLTLSTEDIFQVAENLGSEAVKDLPHSAAGDHKACFDHISSFLNSKHLLESEDTGMTELLTLNDFIDNIIATCDMQLLSGSADGTVSNNTRIATTTVDMTQTTGARTVAPHQNTASLSNAKVNEQMFQAVGPINPPDAISRELKQMLSTYKELGKKIQSMMSPTGQVQVPTLPLSQFHRDTSNTSTLSLSSAQPVREGVISLVELSYLHRREFKVKGGQIHDQSSDISYNKVCKQIEEGIKERFSDAEIVRGVLKIIKPEAFKDMLTNKDNLTVLELKGFLQAHLRGKNSTELFGELISAKQEGSEMPQQFLYRVIALKQRVLLTCRLSDAGIKYNPTTI